MERPKGRPLITADELQALTSAPNTRPQKKRPNRYNHLSDADVQLARAARAKEGLSVRRLASIFGCGITTMHDILTGKIRT
jgi:hypothetical protein